MNLRGFAALALLLVAIGLERVGYYGSRSFLALDLRSSGASSTSLGLIYSSLQGVVLLGMILGGAAALGIGPRVTAALGALIAAGGQLALAAGAPITLGAGLIAFGAGMFRPCPFAVAAELLAWDDESPLTPGPHRFAAVAAFCVLAYGGINAGALAGPPALGLVRSSTGPAVAHGAGGALMVLCAIVCFAAVLLGLDRFAASKNAAGHGPYRDARPPAATTPLSTGTMLAGLALLFIPQAIFLLGISLPRPPYEQLSSAQSAWALSVNSVSAIFASLLVFALLLVATLQRSTVPPLLVYGVALLVFGVGLVPAIVAGNGGLAPFVIGEAVRGLAEAALFGVPVAYAAIAMRGRIASLVVAGWLGLGVIVTMMSNVLAPFELARTIALVLSALLAVASGIVLITQGKKLHFTFFSAA
jgi:hypothetical protein